jgi:hypothetical protein
MKKLKISCIVWLFAFMPVLLMAQAQPRMEVPGDNFSLEGALDLFKKSSSPEEFEQMLNNPETKVNNLDLNGDGYIDYMRVFDIQEANVHAFVIQAVISERERQDIAVITLEKLANGRAIVQITGDEAIYGIETIIEPSREVYLYAGSTTYRETVNVWNWPSVQFIYGPHYNVWVSPWGWGSRPIWWRAWRPIVYHDYYYHWTPYRHIYTYCYAPRVMHIHHVYRTSYRRTSVTVHTRHHRQINRYRSARIDADGRYVRSNSRSDSRSRSTSVRYTPDGRISSVSRSTTRSSSGARDGRSVNSRSSVNRSDYQSSRNSSSRNAGIERSSSRSSGSTSVQRSSSSSGSRQSSGGSSIQRSSSRSSGSSSVQRSGSSSGSRQSSGGSSIQRSSSRSSGSSSVQRSSSSSGSRQSSGSSSIQRSSSRSSGSSSVQRSSSSSGSRQSSGSSSRSSGSSRNSSSRGRQ